jgi:hypothetical protein
MKTALFVFLGGLFFLSSHLAFAGVSYTVTPLVIDTKAEARDILNYEITLTNTGSQPVDIYPSVNNISVNEGGTIQKFLPPSMSDRTASLAAWIEINRGGVHVAKGESKTVPMTIHIGPSPKPGVYHALIGFGHGGNSFSAQKEVKNGSAPGVVVTVNIDQNQTELLRLSRFVINRFVTAAKNQDASYVINNPGDKTLVPQGDIIFYDSRGVEVASLPVNPDKVSIPAGKEKTFNVSVPTKGLFGKYKAFLSVEYGSQLASVQDTEFFYVFPFKILMIILGVLTLLVAFVSFYIHRRYLDASIERDMDLLHFHIKETPSEPKEHDIDLKQL